MRNDSAISLEGSGILPNDLFAEFDEKSFFVIFESAI